MASTYPSLAQSLVISDMNLASWEASQLALSAPFMNALYSQTATRGTVHEFLREITAPSAGFRNVNAGVDTTAGTYEKVTATLEVLSANSITDKALADAHPKGKEAFNARYAFARLRKAFSVAESQLFYGTANDSDGFTGLSQATGYTYKDDDMVIDAGGDTVNATWSVWVINSSEDACSLILGQDGKINVGDEHVQMIADADGKLYPAYVIPQEGWFGLQIASKYDMARIVNLDFDHPLTDDLIYNALELFPTSREGRKLIVCNKKAQGQLRASRTATNPSGAPAPLVQDVEGHPIIVTDALTVTEAVKTATP